MHAVEEAENVTKFLNETTIQWRNLSVEVRSVRSMLEEVVSNWDKYSGTVSSLQAWLEDAEKMLDQPEHAKKVSSKNCTKIYFLNWPRLTRYFKCAMIQ